MGNVKFDMHCHTKEGSSDAKISIMDYIEVLKDKGFGGMLVTDHDTYGGYLAYQSRQQQDDSFVVLRGIEYDTFDYGHQIIVMPTETPEKVYEMTSCRGLSLKQIMEVVHMYGGIIGPAHPGGEHFLSFAMTKGWKRVDQLAYLKKLDFLEGYNASEAEENNKIARNLAKMAGIPMTAGSDAHKADCAGLGYALLPDTIRNEDDLIAYYKSGKSPRIGGRRYGKTTKDKLGFWNRYLVVGFFFYNKFFALLNRPKALRLYKELVKNSV